MDAKKMNDLLEEIVLGKFLVNFVPGLILYYTLTTFLDVRVGEGLIAFVIVASVSWTLGVLLELIFFRKSFYRKETEAVWTRIQNIHLLLGKVGVSTVIGCVLCIDINLNPDHYKDLLSVLKLVFFGVGGVLLYIFYVKQSRKVN